MATFERYFVEDKELHKEKKGYYYTLRNRKMSAIRFWQSLELWSSFAYHQRSCACENDSGRTANESQWQAFRY
ncbi:fructose-1,6-bisphosphatase [Parabacteroides johnsonii]|nr:fructose-1,6-bisphosphatase [Parabacteroides johnsonii]